MIDDFALPLGIWECGGMSWLYAVRNSSLSLICCIRDFDQDIKMRRLIIRIKTPSATYSKNQGPGVTSLPLALYRNDNAAARHDPWHMKFRCW
jgi:hypothetical protein